MRPAPASPPGWNTGPAAFAWAASVTSFRGAAAGAWADASPAALPVAGGRAGVLAIILWQNAGGRRDKVPGMRRAQRRLGSSLA